MKLNSQIQWITFSQQDIQKARLYLESLKGESTVDVLGLQSPMEVVSELLFPATSTLHKRIRYQIFIPAILWAIYERGPREDAERDLLEYEKELQRNLLKCEDSDVLGSNRGEALKYWPSLIYWNSLNTLQFWGPESLSQARVFEIIDYKHKPQLVNDNGELESEAAVLPLCEELQQISRKLYFAARGRTKEASAFSFDLTRLEADFLNRRFTNLFRDSLTTYLLKLNRISLVNPKLPLFGGAIQSNPKLSHLVREAKNFSLMAMGATYAYRWTLCKDIASRSKRNIKEGDDGVKANACHFESWLSKSQFVLNRWRFESLEEAIAPYSVVDGEKKCESHFPLESGFLNEFAHSVKRKVSASKILAGLEGQIKQRETDVKGETRSHFFNREIEIPDNTYGKKPFRMYAYDFRWEQGAKNVQDILRGRKLK